MNTVKAKTAAMAAAAMLLGGCGGTYLLTSDLVASSQEDKAPEIVETPRYDSDRAQFQTVAVRAPDSCSNQTTNQATGDANAAGTVLQTSCGIEMSEIEKALSKRHYRVISWKVLAHEMNDKNKSVTEIAGALGADVIFQINSLEQSKKNMGSDARWERKYYDSDSYGKKIKERSFDDKQRDNFRSTFLGPKEGRYSMIKLAATLDASVVLVKTGEAIWYYRWTYADPTVINYQTAILVNCDRGDIKCVAIAPEKKGAQRENVKSSGESDAVSVTEKPADIEKRQYAKLISAVIDNMVQNFAKK